MPGMTYEEKLSLIAPGITVHLVEIDEVEGKRVAQVHEVKLRETDTKGLFNLGGRVRMYSQHIAMSYSLSRKDAIDEYLEQVQGEVRELLGKIEPLMEDIRLVYELKGADPELQTSSKEVL